MKTKHWLLSLWLLIVFALHQDVWNWMKVGPLLFGIVDDICRHLLIAAEGLVRMAKGQDVDGSYAIESPQISWALG